MCIPRDAASPNGDSLYRKADTAWRRLVILPLSALMQFAAKADVALGLLLCSSHAIDITLGPLLCSPAARAITGTN
jgi:hypothetical protein